MLEVLRCAAEDRPERQFLISTHSPIIAHGLGDTVLALPSGAFMPTADYFAAMKAFGPRIAAQYRAAFQFQHTPTTNPKKGTA